MAIPFVAQPGCGPRSIQVSGEIANRDGYARLLSRIIVDEKIDWARLLENRRFLDEYLTLLRNEGPETTPDRYPDRDSSLAYILNGHNAMMLRSLIALAKNGEWPDRLPLNLDRRFLFPVDGRLRTPADMREQALSLAGTDWRVRLALFSGRRDGPPLVRRQFLGDVLDMQLDQVTREALASDRIVRIDHGVPTRLLLWHGLFDIKEQLAADYENRHQTTGATLLSVLLEWSPPFRRQTLNAAVGYSVAPMPPDPLPN
ncbi:MAG: hypothetical protein ACE5EC_01865 [Phycisphaerae bacterium]